MNNKNNTKQVIIKKAIHLFSKNGYEGTSMRDIAASVGIKKASLYSHFKGKEEIFFTIYQGILETYSHFLKSLIQQTEGESLERALTHILRQFIQFYAKEQSMRLWERIYLFPPECMLQSMTDKAYQIEMSFIHNLENIFQDSHRIKNKDQIPSIVKGFYYLLMGFSLSNQFYQNDLLEKDIKDTLEIFFYGIATQEEY
ncbi:MAG: TetR/AcrR family transcriptional regulator [Spirochaetes bacterium]|nr:TetR/AcrR family transcriptional regulator [Spirochaetota bacterium]